MNKLTVLRNCVFGCVYLQLYNMDDCRKNVDIYVCVRARARVCGFSTVHGHIQTSERTPTTVKKKLPFLYLVTKQCTIPTNDWFTLSKSSQETQDNRR